MKKEITAILLPTDKASNIYQSKTSLDKSMKVSSILESPTDYTTNYFLYILGDFKTSEDKCKQGEWKYCSFTNDMTRYDQFAYIPGTGWCEDCRKIIGTNDPDLFISVDLRDTTATKFPGAISFSDMEYIADWYNGKDINLGELVEKKRLALNEIEKEYRNKKSPNYASDEFLRIARRSVYDGYNKASQLSGQWEKYLHADYKPYAKGTGLMAEYEYIHDESVPHPATKGTRLKLDQSGNIIIH